MRDAGADRASVDVTPHPQGWRAGRFFGNCGPLKVIASDTEIILILPLVDLSLAFIDDNSVAVALTSIALGIATAYVPFGPRDFISPAAATASPLIRCGRNLFRAKSPAWKTNEISGKLGRCAMERTRQIRETRESLAI